MDQFFISTPWWLEMGYGQEGDDNNEFHGGTIFYDAAPGVIWVKSQISLGADEAIMAKTCTKEWLQGLAHAKIKHINTYNDIFCFSCFQADCTEKYQSHSC